MKRTALVLLSLLVACALFGTGQVEPRASQSGAGSTAQSADPLAKYDPQIELTAVGLVGSDYKYLPGETFEDNAWTRVYRDELGINLKYKWYTDATMYNQKLSLSMASNDLPDVMRVMNPNDLSILKTNNQLADLTDIYARYGSPALKAILEFDPKAFGLLHANGRLVATGMPNNIYEGILELWIRQDWLDNLGLSAPKSMEDVVRIARAFTTQDPDGDGSNDTIGFPMFKEVMGGAFADMYGFFNGYNAYPRIWIRDKAGQVVYGSIQPEMKDALLVLQQLYREGVIDKEFGMMDGGKATEATTSGRAGMEYGAWWNAAWPLADSMIKDPKADWRPFPIVAAGGKPVHGETNGGFSSYFVVSRKCAHPEALIKLHNFYLMTLEPKNAVKYQRLFGGEPGNKRQSEGQAIAFGQLNYPDISYRLSLEMSDAIRRKDPSGLNESLALNYQAAMKWVTSRDLSDPQNYVQYICFGAGDISAQAGVQGSYIKNKSYMINEFAGSPTPTMVEKKAVLDTMEIEMITRVIMGKPLSEFDTFVADWRRLGGDQITREVNDWSAANK